MRRESAGHFGRADVIGDVTIKRFTRQTKRAVTRRNGVRGMIAGDERPAVERAWNDFESRISALGHAGINPSCRLHRVSLGKAFCLLQPAIVAPPSMTMVCPVMNDPALDAR